MTDKEIVKKIAYSLRISHEEIAESLGTSRGAVSNLLRSEGAMRSDKLSAICRAMGASLVIKKGNKEYEVC